MSVKPSNDLSEPLAHDDYLPWAVDAREVPDDVRTMVYADGAGVARVVFVVSDADRPVTATLLASETAAVLRDPLARETLRVDGGKVSVALPARGVRMLIVE